jgi:type IV secretion system protein VirD4
MKKRLLAIVAGAVVLLLAWGMSQAPDSQPAALFACLLGTGLVAIGIRRKRSERKDGIVASMLYGLARFNLMLSALVMGYCFVLMIVLFLPWSLIAVLGMIAWFGKRGFKQLTSGGTAAWASKAQMWAAGLLGATSGPILGRCGDKGTFGERLKVLFAGNVSAKQACEESLGQGSLVRLPQAVATATFSPTGGGKGVSCVVPFLLDGAGGTGADSVICVDIKGDLSSITSRARQRVGKVFILDPFGVVVGKLKTKSARLDPVDFISVENAFGLDDAKSAADAIVPREKGGDGKTEHFYGYAVKSIGGYMAATAAYGEKAKGTRCLGNVASIVNSGAKTALVQELMRKSPYWGGMLAEIGNSLGHATGEELSSIRSVTAQRLEFLNTQAFSAVVRDSTFDPAIAKREPISVYFVLPPEFLNRNGSAWLRLMIDTCLKRIIRQGLGEQRKIHFIIDEAGTVLKGGLESVNQALSVYRAYGIRTHLYFQSRGQLQSCFDDHGVTMDSNTVQTYFGVNDLFTQQHISQRCGRFTETVHSGGTNSGGGQNWSYQDRGGGGGGSSSYGSSSNWSPQPRDLLSPDEVGRLSPRIAITFVPGMNAIWTNLVRYYEEPWLFKGSGIGRPFGMLVKSTLVFALFAAMAAMLTLVAMKGF